MSNFLILFLSTTKSFIREILLEVLEEYFANQGFHAPEKEFLDAPSSAEFIGESLSSFYRRTSNREVPFYKRGKKIFCKKAELIKWLESGKKKSRAEVLESVA